MTRITIDLPEPKHTVSNRGFKALVDWYAHERSNADYPVVSLQGEDFDVDDAEAWALAILWLVREHYHGNGLDCEV